MCGLLKGSILGPLLPLIYLNDMLQAVNSNLFYMLTIHVLLKISNNDSANICSWFVDSKLSIPFGEEETKSILTKSNIKKPNIKY